MKAIFILLISLFCLPAFSQQAIIKGRVSNLNAPNDTAFTLYFKREGKIVDSTISRKAGFYQKQLPAGQYDIVISKTHHISQTLQGIELKNAQNEINLSLKFVPKPREFTSSYPRTDPKSDTLYIDGVRVSTSSMVSSASIKKSSSSYSKSGKAKKRKKSKGRKRSKHATRSSAKKSGIRSSTGVAAHAAGTTESSRGVVGRGSRSDASVVYDKEAPPEAELKDKDIGSMRAGQVTAGHWRDLDHWKDWLKTNNNKAVAGHMSTWGLYPKRLNMVKIVNQKGETLPFVKVRLMDGAKVVWETVTDTEGKAYLWPMVEKDSVTIEAKDLVLEYHGLVYNVPDYASFNSDNIIRISTKLRNSQRIEIGFMVDATGSMGDEIKFLQRELIDVVSRIKKERPCSEVYTGSVFYKDHGDDYLTRIQPMTSNPVNTIDFISYQYASGGGDFPEAVEDGLEAAIRELNWSDEAGTKILFMLLDAPPHQSSAINQRLSKAIRLAASKGIRLVPVAASGINQQTEFLLKYMAILSNGEYLYITDDSNIGGRHLLPTGGKSDVEFLNDLMVKTIVKYSVNVCPEDTNSRTTSDSTQQVIQQQPQQNEFILGSNWHMRYYPNPATDVVHFEFSEAIERISIYSIGGQLVYERNNLSDKSHQVDLGQISSGIYSVQVFRKGELLSGKLVVIH